MNNIFVGFIFILFDFSLTFGGSTISLMPSFLGYWFWGRGLADLQGKSPTLAKMTPWARGMMIFTAITWVLNVLAISFGIFDIIIGIVASVLTIYVTYKVVAGIKEVEEYHQTYIYADELRTAWVASTIASISTLFLAWIPLIGFVVTLIAIAINIYFMVIMNKVKKAYEEIPPVQRENQMGPEEI